MRSLLSQFRAFEPLAHVRFSTALLVSVLTLTLLAADALAETNNTSQLSSLSKPMTLTPPFGSTSGGQSMFVEVEEPVPQKGKSSIACRFASSPTVYGHYDMRSGHYICLVPPHPRPESVDVTILINGLTFKMPEPYVYTTHGKHDSPVTKIHVPRLQERVKWIKEQLPDKVKLCAVLKNGNPPGWLEKP